MRNEPPSPDELQAAETLLLTAKSEKVLQNGARKPVLAQLCADRNIIFETTDTKEDLARRLQAWVSESKHIA